MLVAHTVSISTKGRTTVVGQSRWATPFHKVKAFPAPLVQLWQQAALLKLCCAL